ncbi:MAG: ribbon-helix-helix protein, CopG family [Clostridia bacterium]|nr:ribbon-helix-helix protein, CopG family [Clostridia bacterium]
MGENVLKIKRRGDDGYKVISVRIKEDTLEALDKLAAETNYSRNELINLLLRHGVENVEIE